MRSIVSVSDKDGLVEFFGGIMPRISELYASSGTQKFLLGSGIPAKNVSELTGCESLLHGRVKTLHPAVFAGILSPRDKVSNAQMQEFRFKEFDLVVSNLYPFDQFAHGDDVGEMVENIDIGGVSLIRAAAKNFKFVTVLVDRRDYPSVMKEISDSGNASEETRKRLAVKAFSTTARYDALITESLNRVLIGKHVPAIPDLSGAVELRYGENPDQFAIMVPDGSAKGIPGAFKMSGKELSYNNIVDADAAMETVLEFANPATVIVKHGTPCGASEASTLKDSYLHALAGDTESAYGSVIAMNRNVDDETAEELLDLFIEVLVAPGYDESSFNTLRKKKKNLRILKARMEPDTSMRIRSISHGILSQSPTSSAFTNLAHAAGPDATETQMRNMLFAWKVVSHCRSNAIVLANGTSTVGIGAGQTSRVEALRIAARKAESRVKGSAMASDGYLPFSDSVTIAAESGISAIIQPGGSIRDPEVIAKANDLSIPMYFTGKRVFLH